MKKLKERLKNFTTCDWVGYTLALGVVITFVYILATGGEGWSTLFWWNPNDTGMDFFHSLEYVRGRVPYEKFYTLYPPLANLLFYFLYCMVPSWQTENWPNDFSASIAARGGEFDLRYWQPTMMIFIIFVMVSAICMYILFEKYLENYKTGKLAALGLVVAYGMLYAYERGNIVLFVFLFIMVFIAYRNSENKLLSELALISLAIAAGLKLYPALFGVLLIYDKQWKKAIRTVIYGILMFFVPFFAFEEGLGGLPLFLGTLTKHSSTPIFTCNGFSADKLLNTIVYTATDLVDANAPQEFLISIAGTLNISMALILLVLGFFMKKNWERILVCSLALIVYQQQYNYILIMLIVPLLVLLREEQKVNKSNAVVLIGILLTQILLPLENAMFETSSEQYTRIQIGICILLAYVFYRASKEIQFRLSKILLKIGMGVMVVGAVFATIATLPDFRNFTIQNIQSVIREEDYTLVYNEEDYIAYNPDIDFEALRNSGKEDAIFNHFLDEGMADGRRAHKDFDVVYYREQYQDVENECLDNWESYYRHYMKTGYHEGRAGAGSDIETDNYTVTIKSSISDGKVVHEISTRDDVELQKLYIMQLPVYESVLTSECVVKEIMSNEISAETELGNLTDRYVVAVDVEGVYVTVSNIAYISNPEAVSKMSAEKKETTAQIACDFIVEDLVCAPGEKGLSYQYDGQTYYFDRASVNAMDDALAQWARDGVEVSARILCRYDASFGELYYSGVVQDETISYYAINTSNQYGAKTLEALVSFFTNRYNGTDQYGRLISNWIVGTNVNDHALMNNMGGLYFEHSVAEYARSFRIVYNTAIKENGSIQVYAPLNDAWGANSTVYANGGREFINWFNLRMQEEGDINWGVAMTIKPYDESSMKAEMVANHYDSDLITTKNSAVLERYMNSDILLNSNEEVRPIMMMEVSSEGGQ